jgi:predicted GNAT superfamily acetyltransferase
MQVADVRSKEFPDVLALNQASVPHVNSLELDDIAWFASHANYFRVARISGDLAGFLIGLGPGLDYASPNYRYFCSRHAAFGYVDRVVVAAAARRKGVGSKLYDDYAASLRSSVPFITCEVNIRPPNESSMAYHEEHGFACIATQETEGGKKKVALMEKRL